MRKTCRLCGKLLGTSKRDKSIFCDDTCRYAFHNALKVQDRKCPTCGVPAILPAGQEQCLRCQWHDYAIRFVHDYAALIEWLNDKLICFYCGEGATDREHVMPQRTGIRSFTVPACRECNQFAGGEIFASIEEKSKFIQDKRRIKYARILRTPEWTIDELEEMGDNLRRYILAYQKAREIIEAQLSWSAFLIVTNA